MREHSGSALLVAMLAFASGCAQVLGLGDYGNATDAGEAGSGDAPADTSAPEDTAVDEGTADGVVDSSGDVGAEADAAASSSGAGEDAGDGSDASDAPADSPLETGPDAGCTGTMSCAPAAPSGWTGPLALWEGTSGAPACGSAFPLVAFDGGFSVTSPPANCTCACGTPTAATCGPITMQFGQGGCTAACGPDGGLLTVANGTCGTATNYSSQCGATMEVAISGSTASGGSCALDASTSVPAWSWGSRAIACQPTSQSPVGCPAGEQCVPSPQSPFEAHFCVLQAGSASCPAGAYSVQHLYYAGASDTRACTACGCGAPTGVDCNANAHVTTWNSNNCLNNQTGDITPLPAGCSTPAASMHGAFFQTTPSGGACPASGGQPTGSVAEQGLTTICCTP
jgi:hypothetical protein